jgi:hypothetical protein
VLELLAKQAGRCASIVAEEPVGHEWAPVTRISLDRPVPGFGSTVIVKTRRVEGEGHGGVPHLRREQAGLRLALGSGVTPRLLAAEDRAGVIIAADLGRWPSLETVLLGDDHDRAAAAVIDLGRAVGRLHGATLGLEALHRDALAALGTRPQEQGLQGEWAVADRWPAVERLSAELGFPDATASRGDIADLALRLLKPAHFGALVHMDLNPTNVLVTDQGAKLVDFESSVYGHLGMDVVSLHFPFPCYSAHWAVLPDEVVVEADRAYRAELARHGPPDALQRHDEALAVGAAALLAVRVQRLAKLARENETATASWRRRAQLLQQIRVFERMAPTASLFPTLAGWFSRLGEAMARRWQDATSPAPRLFPAFARR